MLKCSQCILLILYFPTSVIGLGFHYKKFVPSHINCILVGEWWRLSVPVMTITVVSPGRQLMKVIKTEQEEEEKHKTLPASVTLKSTWSFNTNTQIIRTILLKRLWKKKLSLVEDFKVLMPITAPLSLKILFKFLFFQRVEGQEDYQNPPDSKLSSSLN